MKRRLTQSEEFEILKLVLDKFLWLGVGIMAFGLYRMISATMRDGLYFLIVGVCVLVVFIALVIKEYEYLK